MRILVNGLPYFSERLVKDLNNFDTENHYLFLNTYESFWAKIKFFIFLPFYDKVISMNGVSDESGSLNWVVRWKKPLLMLWQGSDVTIAMERFQNKTIDNKYIHHACHFAVAPWLVEELESIEIKAEVLSFLWVEADENIRNLQEFSAISYLAEGREVFYGWNFIKAAALELKHLQFYIVGSNGRDMEKLNNVKFCGWLSKDELQNIYEKSSVYIRMPEHDGNPHFVGEALSKGLDVIWKYPHPRVNVAKDETSLINLLKALRVVFYETKGERNQENIEWVKENLNRNAVLQNFVSKIKAI